MNIAPQMTISDEEWAASDYTTAQKCKKPNAGALGRLKRGDALRNHRSLKQNTNASALKTKTNGNRQRHSSSTGIRSSMQNR